VEEDEPVSLAEKEIKKRWRLILGKEAEDDLREGLDDGSDTSAMDQVLEAI